MKLICAHRNCKKVVTPDKYNPNKMFCSPYCSTMELRLFKADKQKEKEKQAWESLLSKKQSNITIIQQSVLTELECSGADNHMLARDLVRFARSMDMDVFAEHLKLRLVVMQIDIMTLNYDEKYEWFT